VAVGGTAWLTGYLAALYALRPQPFYVGIGFAVAGLLCSWLFARETRDYALLEAQQHTALLTSFHASRLKPQASLKEIFLLISWKDRTLFSCSQAGLVNNLNDGMSWGIYPLFFSSFGLGVAAIGVLKAVYPGVWGVTQVVFGPLSDRIGRKWLIAGGLWVQAAGIWQTVLVPTYSSWLMAAVLQGLGTAMVYPTLLAAISDIAPPQWRATSMGVYRLWRDSGYALGALLAGIVADLLGMRAAIHLVAALTLASGLVVAVVMHETHQRVAVDPQS
jgi:MFS family permease